MNKTIAKKVILNLLVISVICSLALLSACGERENRGYNDSLISPDWYSEKTEMKSPYDYTDEYIVNSGKETSEMYGYPVLISVEDMVKRSALVIRGRVLGFDYLSIEKAGGGATMPHTDYHVEVLDVLRGEPYNSDIITVRSMGGEDNTEIIEMEGTELIVGKEYLLFLWIPSNSGTWFHTEGDYYGIVEVSTSIFEGSSQTVKNADKISVPKTFVPTFPSEVNDENLDYLDFIEKIKEYNELYPVDENYYVKSYQDGLAKNLESGFITQQEYDEGMAELGKHATILYYTQPGDITVNP